LIRELKKNGEVTVHRNMTILSLVRKQMRHLVGAAGKTLTMLGNGNINIEMTSQGRARSNISCVIEGKGAFKALNLIHQTCLQIPATGRIILNQKQNKLLCIRRVLNPATRSLEYLS
ncbi:Aspartokinase, partial [Marasmius crinis-equi]